MDTYLRHLSTLGLEPGVSYDEMRRAYVDLSTRWQPDRFEDNPRLQEKARRTLQELDEAYRYLTQRYQDRGEVARSVSAPTVVTDVNIERDRPVAAAPPPVRPPPKRKKKKKTKETKEKKEKKEKRVRAAARPRKASPHGLGRLGRYSATLAAIAGVAYIVVVNPDMTRVRDAALFVKGHADALLDRVLDRAGQVPASRGNARSPSGSAAAPPANEIMIPRSLRAITQGKLVDALPSLRPGEVIERYGEPRFRNELEWGYGSFSVLFMDSLALLLVRDTASAR